MHCRFCVRSDEMSSSDNEKLMGLTRFLISIYKRINTDLPSNPLNR